MGGYRRRQVELLRRPRAGGAIGYVHCAAGLAPRPPDARIKSGRHGHALTRGDASDQGRRWERGRSCDVAPPGILKRHAVGVGVVAASRVPPLSWWQPCGGRGGGGLLQTTVVPPRDAMPGAVNTACEGDLQVVARSRRWRLHRRRTEDGSPGRDASRRVVDEAAATTPAADERHGGVRGCGGTYMPHRPTGKAGSRKLHILRTGQSVSRICSCDPTGIISDGVEDLTRIKGCSTAAHFTVSGQSISCKL